MTTVVVLPSLETVVVTDVEIVEDVVDTFPDDSELELPLTEVVIIVFPSSEITVFVSLNSFLLISLTSLYDFIADRFFVYKRTVILKVYDS